MGVASSVRIPSAQARAHTQTAQCAKQETLGEHEEDIANSESLLGNWGELPPDELTQFKPVVSIVQDSIKHALGGGTTGATAAFAQVIGLMWMNTIMNFQVGSWPVLTIQ